MFESTIISPQVIIALLLLLVTAVAIESRTGRIPNWLNASGILVGLGLCLYDRLWLTHFSGFAVGLGAGVFMWTTNPHVGAGYAKLIAAVGTIGGPMITITTTVLALFVMLTIPRLAERGWIGSVDEDGQRSASVWGSAVILAGTLIEFAIVFVQSRL